MDHLKGSREGDQEQSKGDEASVGGTGAFGGHESKTSCVACGNIRSAEQCVLCM